MMTDTDIPSSDLFTSRLHGDADFLPPHEWAALDATWRAANYLTVGQIYLLDNPLLERPLERDDVKPRLLGHWGTSPGLNLIYAHCNRVIVRDDLDMIFIAGPGHGGPAVIASVYLEGTYPEYYPEIDYSVEGMRRLFRQFSFPYGVPSHVAPETPGSIHEGGELGYSLSHAFGAAFDNPDLIVTCVIGDGEAETGPLATSWHANKFLDPQIDGAVLPVLHLNGYKIANPTVLSRISEDELGALLYGYGWDPIWVSGEDTGHIHHDMARAMDVALERIRGIQHAARLEGDTSRPRWPMIVLRTPKGWTGPVEVDGVPVEDTWRAHQVPLAGTHDNATHRRMLEEWMRSYRPEELFEPDGTPIGLIRDSMPRGTRRMGDNPHANGGLLLTPLRMPDFRDYAVPVDRPGVPMSEPTRVLGAFLRDVLAENLDRSNLLFVSPDEHESNRLGATLEVSGKRWLADTRDTDVHLSRQGRVLEMLSEHTCQGWLEGYLLTGRHGLMSCYEAFIHIVDSMFNQHAKWLSTTRHIPWRRPISSLNYLLTSHVWRQDHNGLSHQDPGFIDHAVNKKADVIRIYLPPDTNTLLSTMDHCLRSQNYINIVVSGKQPTPNWLDMDAAVRHCTRGIGIWEFASTDDGEEPDVIMACAGDVPTVEILAAVSILNEHLPHLRIRVINIVDLMRLQPESEHPHGLSDREFDALFTTDRPIIMAYHGYPWLIHRLTYRRTNHSNIHVRGYKEEGSTTTPFDMCVRNEIDRFHLVIDVIDRVPGLSTEAAWLRQHMSDLLIEHRHYVVREGEDMPMIAEWAWPS
jgi:xylulose-5-phosphate/fructose-6-phosphate phosphoketolase